jgi:hypothetical protein
MIIGIMALNHNRPELRAMSLTFGKKDFPQDGLMVITPSDPAFDSELSSALKKTNNELSELIQAAKPFSVFVRNSSDLSIVGCSLEWIIVKPDGSVLNQGQSYSTPGALMGMKPMDEAMTGHTDLINPHSTAFISLDPETKQFFDWRTRSFVSLSELGAGEKQEIEEHVSYLRKTYKDLLTSGTKITISIDATIFSDGSFLGPDNNRLIAETRSMVNAKRDLAELIERDIRHHRSSEEIFERIDLTSKNPTLALKTSNQSASEDYIRSYSRYMQIHIQELLRIREAKGDEVAIKYSQRTLHETWPTLRPKSALTSL